MESLVWQAAVHQREHSAAMSQCLVMPAAALKAVPLNTVAQGQRLASDLGRCCILLLRLSCYARLQLLLFK